MKHYTYRMLAVVIACAPLAARLPFFSNSSAGYALLHWPF